MFNGLLGKYRAVVLSVAMFIFLDAGVLVLNFYISSQLAEDASNVNLAGRQRMLSQKTAKAFYDYDKRLSEGGESESAYQELQQAVALFDRTLVAFDQGGATRGASRNELVLDAVSSDASRAAVEAAKTIWRPISSEFKALFATASGTLGHERALRRLAPMVRDNNNQLLKLMNDLTNDLETIARNKSETLRMIQAGAITLAILNFLLILFHFIGQLRRSDSVAEEARSETTEILKNVREGLLLLDGNLTIGTQYSGSIRDIFGHQEYAGTSFRVLLKSLVTESDMQTVEEYIKLLLNSSVKENLIGSLNPLSDIEVSLPDDRGGFQVKHLSFRFNRAIENGEIRHVLVTVLDISELVGLRRELEQAAKNNGLQINALKELLHVDKDSMMLFMTAAESSLVAVNDILRQRVNSSSDFRDKVVSSQRIMHRVKGDASALNLPEVVRAVHEFEQQLEEMADMASLQGGDFLPLTLALNDLFRLLGDMKDVVEVLGVTPMRQQEPVAVSTLDSDRLGSLVTRIAAEQGKQVTFELAQPECINLPAEQLKVVQDCAIQLLRNAVVHGVEPIAIRQQRGKDDAGRVVLKITQEDDGYRVSVRDDGRGIQLETIRQRAIEKGLYSAEQLDSMQATRIMSLVFDPGFSTLEEADEHGGRGIGMDVVKANIQQLHGRIRVANRPGQYCEISFLIPAQVEQYEVAVAV
tara:strand:- start:2448 stop:4544 length:2097 start_codon:yes stop_codon:yes gene_type:complete